MLAQITPYLPQYGYPVPDIVRKHLPTGSRAPITAVVLNGLALGQNSGQEPDAIFKVEVRRDREQNSAIPQAVMFSHGRGRGAP